LNAVLLTSLSNGAMMMGKGKPAIRTAIGKYVDELDIPTIDTQEDYE
jgi:hypothetical protein